MLTPQEVSTHAFSKAVMGGYNMAMVDEFLDELTDDYTTLYKENAALKAKMKVLVEKVEDYRATEDSMRATLLTAQKMADSIVHEAEAKRDELLEQLAARTEELEALELARAVLAQANEALRQRFSPALNQKAGELFRRLTSGSYQSVTLTRAFEASAAAPGELRPHSSLLLSRGTVDQLYLAVRLAVCELTWPDGEKAPLVLDDALANFDDSRMELALTLLKELGQTRQILLFTCHSREADFFAGDPEVAVQRL